MKQIDCHAMGKLIEELLQQESQYPIASIEDGYEQDNIQTTMTPTNVGAICDEILVVTHRGHRFRVSIHRLPDTPKG